MSRKIKDIKFLFLFLFSSHYLPFKFTKIDFWPPDIITFCTISRYLICIAEFIFRIYDVYFSILAVYTSAFALIMLAYDTRFWIAADWRFFFVYSFNIRSKLKTPLPLIKIFSMYNPHAWTWGATTDYSASASFDRFYKNSWKVCYPATVLKPLWAISAMNVLISWRFVPSLYTNLYGSTVR